MKRPIFLSSFIFISFCAISCISSKQTASIDVTTGLIAYYPFEGNANDISGNNQNASEQGNYTYVNGVRGKAIRIIGENTSYHVNGGYVRLPMIDTTNLKAFTICMWVQEDTMITGGEAYIYFGTDCDIGWCGLGHFDVHYNYSVGSNNAINYPLVLPFDSSVVGKWTFYSLVYGNKYFSVYVNSNLIGGLKQKLFIYGNNATIGSRAWGGRYRGYSSRMVGEIDEVRLYNRALSVEEIRALYQNK